MSWKALSDLLGSLLGESTRPESKGDVVRQLEAIGASLEWSSDNLLAVSAKGAAQTKEVADYLYSRQNAGDLIYETGRQ